MVVGHVHREAVRHDFVGVFLHHCDYCRESADDSVICLLVEVGAGEAKVEQLHHRLEILWCGRAADCLCGFLEAE